jgi:hypothetical protein
MIERRQFKMARKWRVVSEWRAWAVGSCVTCAPGDVPCITRQMRLPAFEYAVLDP